jgi:hypothetical protein
VLGAGAAFVFAARGEAPGCGGRLTWQQLFRTVQESDRSVIL